MRSIEIDFDVHKRIEAARVSFEETDNEVLRRLLAVGSATSNPSAKRAGPEVAATARAWSGKGVELPHGTELKMEYNGKIHYGQIDDGVWNVEGTKSTSPSDAAGSAARTKDGTRPNLNGWNYWQIKRPTDRNWGMLSGLRKNR